MSAYNIATYQGGNVVLDAAFEPYSGLVTEAQLAQTQANFPALGILIKCTETGGTVLTESVSGARITTTSTIVANADGTVTMGSVFSGAGNVSGQFQAPNLKNILVITLAKPTSATISMWVPGGGGAGTKYFKGSIGSSASHKPRLNDGTTSYDGSALSSTLSGLMATATLLGRGVNVITSAKYDGTTYTEIASPAVDSTLAGTLDYLGPSAVVSEVSISGMQPALLAAFYVNTLPSAALIKAALIWMHNNTFVNAGRNKTLYPGLRSLR